MGMAWSFMEMQTPQPIMHGVWECKVKTEVALLILVGVRPQQLLAGACAHSMSGTHVGSLSANETIISSRKVSLRRPALSLHGFDVMAGSALAIFGGVIRGCSQSCHLRAHHPGCLSLTGLMP